MRREDGKEKKWKDVKVGPDDRGSHSIFGRNYSKTAGILKNMILQADPSFECALRNIPQPLEKCMYHRAQPIKQKAMGPSSRKSRPKQR